MLPQKAQRDAKRAATPAANERAAVPCPIFEFFSFFAAIPLRVSASPRELVFVPVVELCSVEATKERESVPHAENAETRRSGPSSRLCGFAAFPVLAPSQPSSGSKAAKPPSRDGRKKDDAGAMPASACEVFSGQAPED